jgi:hypothetical protein
MHACERMRVKNAEEYSQVLSRLLSWKTLSSQLPALLIMSVE